MSRGMLQRILDRLSGGRAAPAPATRPRDRGHRIERIGGQGTYSAFGYHSARVADKEGRAPVTGSGDSHSLYDRERLVVQARTFMRDNGIFAGLIDRATSYIVGNGFGLQAKSANAEWNNDAERIWRAFWRRPEIRGTLSGRGVERMICRELLVAGDVGVIKAEGGKLQLIESEQIKGKEAKGDGIEKDDIGRPTAYWVSPWGPNGGPLPAQAKRYLPDDFLFVARLDRPSISRGVPPCQASFPMLHRINDVCDSEAIAWQLLSKIAVRINRTGGPSIAYQTSIEDDNKSGTDAEGDFASRVHELDDALIFHGELGEEVNGIERNIPGKDFPASLTMFLRLLGLPLGLPLEVVLLDWTKSNYSQSRAVLEQAYTTFLAWQLLLEDFFYRPVYEWVISQAIDRRELAASDDAFEHEWIKPSFPWIDQLKEAEAYGAKLDRGFCTLGQVLKGLGMDRAEVLAARKREVIEAMEISDDIEKQKGKKVSWEIFCGLAVTSASAKPEPGAPRKDGDDSVDETKERAGEDEEKARGAQKEPVSVAPAAPALVARPLRTTTEVVERDADGRARIIVQQHEYEPPSSAEVVERDADGRARIIVQQHNCDGSKGGA